MLMDAPGGTARKYRNSPGRRRTRGTSAGRAAVVRGRWLLAVSTGHLYWIGTGDGTVNQANLDGSSPQTIASPGPSQVPVGVAVGVGHLYWTTNTDGSIWEANLDGTSAQAIVTGQTDPEGVAVDSSHIYWANNDIVGTINQAPLTGGTPTTLVTGQFSPVAVAVGP